MRFFLITSLVLCLLCVHGCTKKDSREAYPVKIETIKGVEQVSNPGFPRDGVRELTLEEALSIGKDDDDNYLIARPGAIALDGDGNIYMLDLKLKHVKVFDKNGVFLRAISRKGQGPGEVLSPSDAKWDEKNKRLEILDWKNLKISRFHVDGTFDKDVRIKEDFPAQFFLIPNGEYQVLNPDIDEKNNQVFRIDRVSHEGDVLLRSGNFLLSAHRVRQAGAVQMAANTPFDPEGYLDCDSLGNIYYGFADKYVIDVYDSGFQKIRVIKKESPGQVEILESEKEEFIGFLKKQGVYKNFLLIREFPRYYAVFNDLWLDEAGRLIVRLPANDGKIYFDVFDSEGIYVEKWIIDHPFNNFELAKNLKNPVFKGGHIYCRAQDKDGVYYVKKYRLVKKQVQ